ncbi:3-hydroxyacyl-CoA dehydrogenase NAD-binding domain-containing protein [Tabrizicola sp.]|uniref:3-hydroxyacyl-CoA dehydrogenase n=1 Tax=Tabrizicola sp. TaxID=2005166 RepID=UPI0027334B4B|nr:3-hydroxyacyl-CoA dehydrogenase NAD-binding domain-containing protein [Tabrizicola sp.]MDP3196158.1 3-hydroxyacyl-CoA dehydrogenase NAD-binding domain-containing protein [Tabrizicola sp.]
MTDLPIIGVVGLGTMGLGIAQVYAQAGFPVIATDAHPPARNTARDRLAAALDARVAAGKLTDPGRAAVLSRLTVAEDLTTFAPCSLVIEAIAEQLTAKRSLFAALEDVVSTKAILATNTSSLPIHAIADGLRHPDRVLALHFFNPPTAMKLVEMAPQAATDPGALAKAKAWTEAAGKTVIHCPDRPGFIVNRCARPYYGEALALLTEGRSPAEIDAAMTAAGYRLGPFALIDLVGADINLAATEGMQTAMQGHPRYHVFPPLKAQVASGNLGRKTGRGFIFPDPPAPPPPDAQAIALRIEAALANEAHWLLSDGGTTPESIDTAMRLGLNFPRGPFEALARHGRAAILAELSHLRAAAPDALKPRYDPAPGLEAA